MQQSEQDRRWDVCGCGGSCARCRACLAARRCRVVLAAVVAMVVLLLRRRAGGAQAVLVSEHAALALADG